MAPIQSESLAINFEFDIISQLILRKISNGAARCQILRLKCTEFDFPARRAYSAPPDPLAVFNWAYV